MRSNQLNKQVFLLSFLFLATTTSAQNPSFDISSCRALEGRCSNVGICNATQIRASGVGMIPAVLDVPGLDTNLSLTLLDDAQDAGYIPGLEGYTFSRQSLYLGAPTNVNLSTEAPGCALMLQYQQQTFPPSGRQGDTSNDNTTTCDSQFSETFTQLSDMIRAFRYNSGSENSLAALPRCEGLAQFVEYELSNQVPLGSFYASSISVAGGAISGPDVAIGVATPSRGSDDCQPVLPATYELRNVTSAVQVLHSNASMAGDEDPWMGGRVGYTPIVSVFYGSEDGGSSSGNGSEPTVQFLCMESYAADGGELPVDEINYTGGAGAIMPHFAGMVLLVVLSIASTF